jgi:hypothetical protein
VSRRQPARRQVEEGEEGCIEESDESGQRAVQQHVEVGVKAGDDEGRGEAECAMVRHEGRHSALAGDADGGGWGVE